MRERVCITSVPRLSPIGSRPFWLVRRFSAGELGQLWAVSNQLRRVPAKSGLVAANYKLTSTSSGEGRPNLCGFGRVRPRFDSM